MKVTGKLFAGVLIAGALVSVWFILRGIVSESATWGVVGTITLLVVLSAVFGSTSKSASHSEGDKRQVGGQQDDTEDSSSVSRQTFYRHDR